MADKKLSPEAERLLEARTAAIEELKGIDGIERGIRDPHVVRLANARMFEESVSYRVLQGETVSASEVKAGADLVADARAAVPPPTPEVTLTIVSKTRVSCPQCSHTFDTRDVPKAEPVEPAVAIEPSKGLCSDHIRQKSSP